MRNLKRAIRRAFLRFLVGQIKASRKCKQASDNAEKVYAEAHNQGIGA